ncbi:MAG: Flp pilus assembly complex ATPase component TadA [Firmicutes bacterium]|nr:Flp pilus assembly complex ATPase component TadA [Bacillota bacterium]
MEDEVVLVEEDQGPEEGARQAPRAVTGIDLHKTLEAFQSRQRTQESEARPTAAAAEEEAAYRNVQGLLLTEHKDLLLRSLMDPEGTRAELRMIVSDALAQTDLTASARTRVRDRILHQIVGMGPELEPFMLDPEISDIYVVDYETVFVKRGGEKVRTDVCFRSYEDAFYQASRIAEVIGREVKTEAPILDTRLPNGARLNIIVRPAATKGPVITVRKPPAFVKPIDVDRLVELGAISPLIKSLYRVLAGSRVNVVFAGSVDVGKTTNIRAYAQFFPPEDRIQVIEDTEELRLQSPQHPHIFSTEVAAHASMHDLTRAALRQGVDRIMYGEVRSADEIADLRMTWRSGQQGGASSLHSRTAKAVLSRLCEGIGIGESKEDVFAEVTRNLDFVFFLESFPSTRQRFMTGVYEVRSPEAIAEDGGEPLHPLILWRQTGWEDAPDGSRRMVGAHEVVGRLSRETADTVHRYRSPILVREGVTVPEELRPEGWRPW